MNFGKMELYLNKSPIEVIKEGAFEGTYFRDIYSNINDKWYKNSWKEFDSLKNVDPKYYSSNFYDNKINKYEIKYGTSTIHPYGWFKWYFRYYLGRRSSDDE